MMGDLIVAFMLGWIGGLTQSRIMIKRRLTIREASQGGKDEV